MLAELKSATDSGENIAVTLWHPHWAYDAFPIRDLEDPKGTLRDAEKIHTFGNSTFKDDYPEVADAIVNFKITDDQLAEIEHIMFNEYDREQNLESHKTRLEEHPDFEEGIFGGSSDDDSSDEDSSES